MTSAVDPAAGIEQGADVGAARVDVLEVVDTSSTCSSRSAATAASSADAPREDPAPAATAIASATRRASSSGARSTRTTPPGQIGDDRLRSGLRQARLAHSAGPVTVTRRAARSQSISVRLVELSLAADELACGHAPIVRAPASPASSGGWSAG